MEESLFETQGTLCLKRIGVISSDQLDCKSILNFMGILEPRSRSSGEPMSFLIHESAINILFTT
jgi:hypothetical protein